MRKRSNLFRAALIPLIFVESSHATCIESLVSDSPFHVIRVTENKTDELNFNAQVVQLSSRNPAQCEAILNEKFYSDKNRANSPLRFIPKNSLVRLTSPTSLQVKTDLVPIEVLRIPNQESYASMLKDPARVGEKGFVPAGSLKRVDESDTLIVQETTSFFNFGTFAQRKFPEGTAIRPSMTGNQYKVRDCDVPGKGTVRYYVYTIVQDGQKLELGIENANPATCGDLKRVGTSEFNDIQKLLKYLNRNAPDFGNWSLAGLEINEWGNVRLPLEKSSLLPNDFSGITKNGILAHYRGGDPDGSDLWVEPSTACGLLSIAEKWKSVCKQADPRACTMQIGDIGFATPGVVQGTESDPLGHVTHSQARCVDMRLFRNDGKWEGLNLKNDPANFNRTQMDDFITLLKAEGATPIYLNDPELVKKHRKKGVTQDECNLTDPRKDIGKGLLPCHGHDNHLHFCIYPDQSKGCS